MTDPMHAYMIQNVPDGGAWERRIVGHDGDGASRLRLPGFLASGSFK